MKIVEIEGTRYESRIFSGDGQMYDRIRGPQDPVRVGSMLLTQISLAVEIETVPETITPDNEI